MPYDPDKHHRRSIRLKGYDYSQEGAYFVTIILERRSCLLGEIRNGIMGLNAKGLMAWEVWNQLPERFPFLKLDEFIVMPNHIHGILVFVGAGLVPALNPHNETEQVNIAKELGDVIGAFKSVTTHRYIQGVKRLGWPAFNKRFWQRNYHETIIRDETELNAKREYTANNPLKWDEDGDNPHNAAG